MEETLKLTNTLKLFYAASLFIIGAVCFYILVRRLIRIKHSIQIAIIIFYLGLILIQLTIGSLYYFHGSRSNKSNVVNISAILLLLLEYPILTYLVSFKLRSLKARQIILRSAIIFDLSALIIWAIIKTLPSVLSITTTIESIFLIFSCLYFFYELLKSPPTLRLRQESSFWLATGILFLSVCILPFYLAFGYFRQLIVIEILDYVGYAIAMILFTKASMCQDLTT